MTETEEAIVKHRVNCGTPKRRLKQFLLGFKAIEERVHPVTNHSLSLRSTVHYTKSVFPSLTSITHFAKYLLFVRKYC